MSTVRVGIVGVSGYGGGELVRLLGGHPEARLTYVTSGTYKGKPISAALPWVGGLGLTCEEFEADRAIELCDVVFLAGEAGLAMKIAPVLLEAGKRVIDLSADFRLKDPAAYTEWYKSEHTALEWIGRTVYGLPEFFAEDIKRAQLVANPGCYPTAAALSLAPLLAEGLIDKRSIIVDSYSGVSGAGRSKFGLDYHFSEVNESLKPYGVGGVHRHTPEIEQTLSTIAGEPITITFTPHLAPITRGILSTGYANLVAVGVSAEALTDRYRTYYRDKPFVRVLDAGELPATKRTMGTNYCHVGVAVDKRANRVIAMAAQDNLCKGMAGQAVQNMNLMCGFDQSAGLSMSALWP